MPAILSPNAKQQFFTDGSTVAAGFKLYTYAANTVTPQTTYMNRAGTVANTNPIILDARGEATIYLTPGVVYDYVLKTDQDVTVWTREDVTADAGDANAVTFLQAGTGAVSRTSQDKLRERVSAADFGAVEDGVSNDSAALQAAIDSIGAGGGVVSFKGTPLLSNGLTIKGGVTLVGDLPTVGVPGTSSADASNIWNFRSTLLLPSAQTITMHGSSGIEGCIIRRSTMTGPENSAAAYAGTAITVAGEDVSVTGSMVIGFNQAISSDGFQRPRLSDLNLDCVNGIAINNCADVARVESVQCWPFGTIDATAPVQGAIDNTHFLFRNGTAFSITGINDWTKVVNCFSYGYMTGYHVEDSANVQLIGCGADNISQGTDVVLNSAGFVITGFANEIVLNACQTAAQDYGYSFFASIDGQSAEMIGCNSWGIKTNGIRNFGMDLKIQGGFTRGRSNIIGTGLVVSNVNADMVVENLAVQDFGSPLSGGSVRTVNYRGLRFDNYTGPPTGTLLPVVASADPLPLLEVAQYNVVEVSGVQDFGNVQVTYAGHLVVLKFSGSLNVFDGGNIAMSANLATTPEDTLTILCDGTKWVEVSRSAN